MKAFSKKYQAGIGLVELMIAMTLSLVIGAAVIQVFLSQRQTYRTQDDMARVQENARFAFEQIAQDIRQVGYWGCSRKATIVNDTGDAVFNDINDKTIVESAGNLDLVFLNPQPVSSVGGASLTGSTPPVRVVADCSNATMFKSNNVPAGYPAGSLIYELSSVRYAVSNGGLTRAGDNLIPSGVQGLALRYGIASATGWADKYEDAATVGSNWSSVVSVEVTLTLRGEVVGDQVFKSVVAVRNRLP
ncbi:PilW family protein [Pseudomonas peli]|uniref:PilW family protein n=1 Tax=Pseudomonas peli TaxID=592361 RepID=UPI003D3109C1